MIRNLVLDPGVRCIVSALAVLCLPLFWRVRHRGEVLPSQFLVPIRWFARLVAVGFFLAGGAVASSQIPGGPHHGAQLILLGASAFPLADILSRLAVGPAAMQVDAAQLRKFWRGTTQIGLMLMVAGVVLHMAWGRVP